MQVKACRKFYIKPDSEHIYEKNLDYCGFYVRFDLRLLCKQNVETRES